MSEDPKAPSPQNEDARSLARFQVGKTTLIFDRLMTFVINGGGIAVIVAVFGIFFFIFAKTLPLFQKAKVTESRKVQAPAGAHPILGVDEWASLPFVYHGGKSLAFVRLAGAAPSANPIEESPLPLPEDFVVSAARHDATGGRLVLGSTDGRLAVVEISYQNPVAPDGSSKVSGKLTAGALLPAPAAGKVVTLALGTTSSAEVFGAIIEAADGSRAVEILPATRKSGLMGKGKLVAGTPLSLTPMIEGKAHGILVADDAQSILVETEQGEIFYFFLTGDKVELRQRFRPFGATPAGIATMDFLIGDVSLVLTSTTGAVKVFSLFIPDGQNTRLYAETREFPAMPTAPSSFSASRRNKSFLLTAGNEAMIGYSTTTSVRWRHTLGFTPVAATLDPKSEHAFLLDDNGGLHSFAIHDPHPQAGWNAFFGRVWYEGYDKPRHEWQSSGASDDFEPKLSMVPLLIGSLKGTFYAMLFAVPIALLAAIYTAQVLHPKAKSFIKPTMEIMASLPSVVLGFLAALWLAPLIEGKIPSILGMIVVVPALVAATGFGCSLLPYPWRRRIKGGQEFVFLIPVVAIAIWLGWSLGPWIERSFFVATMPDGSSVADFRLWWPQKSGTTFDQRNCVVVGFMMGFAVIPIVFTIAEDALSNVPPSLTAASQALGASRWQVIRTVVLPIAAAGIFSALMVGFGRAVGETMIVVMATGNTPIMDADGNLLLRDFIHNVQSWASGGHNALPVAQHWQPFSGMRTLAANLAVELPEAPENSTHFRALFFGALLLFLMTFALNTVAELLRQHLREKFKLS